MAAFADDAEYLPGDGKVHRGPAAIRAAFTPQFTGAFGAMRFDPEDRLIDETARKAALRWICRHDLSGPHGTRVAPLLRLAIRLRHGSRVGWHGVDVFHFDAAGKITGKYTYANYDRPRLSRALGVALWHGRTVPRHCMCMAVPSASTAALILRPRCCGLSPATAEPALLRPCGPR